MVMAPTVRNAGGRRAAGIPAVSNACLRNRDSNDTDSCSEASAIAVATGIADAARSVPPAREQTSRVVRQHGGWKANRLSAPAASIRIWLWRGLINVAYFESPSKG